MSATATGFSPEVRDGILAREALGCGMEGADGCPGRTQAATDAGHRLNRGIGGDARSIVNDAANGSGQHNRCNFRLEHDAAFAEEGRRRGVKVDHSGDDEALILGTPMWSPYWGQWLVLRRSGAFLTGDTDAARDARTGVVTGSEESVFEIEWKESA